MAQKNEVVKATKNELADKDDFMSGVLAAAQAEQNIRAESGSNLLWISGPLSADSEMCNEDSEAYIKGAKKNSYVIANKQLNLGTKFRAIVIGMFKVFAEQTVPNNQSEMSKTVSYWLPEDAMQIPLEGNFDRPLSNGNVLKPVHWVFLYLPDHPELEGVILSFRSTGNKFYTDLEKVVKAQSKICPELMFDVSSQALKNEKYNKTYYYPKFELQEQRNFSLTENGIKSIKDGLDKEELRTVLERYSELYDAFTKQKTVVSKKTNIAGYLMGSSAPAEEAITDDSDGEPIKF